VLLAQLYDRHADDCARSAETTDNPARRALLLKAANQWRHEAQQLRATEDGAVSAPELDHSSRPKRRHKNKPTQGASTPDGQRVNCLSNR
jgi:hypothetical protein